MCARYYDVRCARDACGVSCTRGKKRKEGSRYTPLGYHPLPRPSALVKPMTEHAAQGDNQRSRISALGERVCRRASRARDTHTHTHTHTHKLSYMNMTPRVFFLFLPPFHDSRGPSVGWSELRVCVLWPFVPNVVRKDDKVKPA